MADLHFEVHPVDLANAIFNAVEVSKDAGGRPGCPHVLIEYGPDEMARTASSTTSAASTI